MSDKIRSQVIEQLRRVAPELEPSDLDPTVDIRDELDVDSMDMLRFAANLHEVFGINIPEQDFRGLSTLDEVVRYVEAHLAG